MEPDPRFSLANERTYLAWTRTALALIAGGVGLEAVAPDALPATVRSAVALGLILLGAVLSAAALRHMRVVQRALREGRPVPAPWMAPVLSAVVALLGLGLVVALFLNPR